MEFNSPQPTLFCVITLLVRLSILDNQYFPFLDFVVISVVIFVVPTWAFMGRRGLENSAIDHGTSDRAEVVEEVVRGVWETENIPCMSVIRGDHPVWQQHPGSPLRPPSPPRGGGADLGRIVTVGNSRHSYVQPFSSLLSTDTQWSFGGICHACEKRA